MQELHIYITDVRLSSHYSSDYCLAKKLSSVTAGSLLVHTTFATFVEVLSIQHSRYTVTESLFCSIILLLNLIH